MKRKRELGAIGKTNDGKSETTYMDIELGLQIPFFRQIMFHPVIRCFCVGTIILKNLNFDFTFKRTLFQDLNFLNTFVALYLIKTNFLSGTFWEKYQN